MRTLLAATGRAGLTAPLLLAVLAGCAAPSGPAFLTEGRSIPLLSLSLKAMTYEAALDDRFLSPEGLLMYRIQNIAGANSYEGNRATGQPSYGDLADGAIWTGTLLGAEALRYGETGDLAVRRRAAHIARALHMLHAVTGVPGLIARSFSYDPGCDPASFGEDWRRAATSYPGYIWRGDASRDQLVGWLFGVGLFLIHCREEPIASDLAADVRAVADRVLDQGFRIVEGDGSETTYGDLDAYYGPIPVGVNAIIDLALFKLAAFATGDARYERVYQALIADGLLAAAYYAKVLILGFTNYNNDNMTLLGAYLLHRLERDPVAHAGLVAGLDRTWTYDRDDRNTLFTYIYQAAAHHAPGREMLDAYDSLVRFPWRKVRVGEDLRGLGLPRRLLPGRGGDALAEEPLPTNLRPATSFQWRSDPRELLANLGARGRSEYAGVDYLLAYWLGRYEGFVGPAE